MKTLHRIGISFMAIALCLGAVSCGNDEDDPIVLNPDPDQTSDPIAELVSQPVNPLSQTTGKANTFIINILDDNAPFNRLTLTEDHVVYAESGNLRSAPLQTRATNHSTLVGSYVTKSDGIIEVTLPDITPFTLEINGDNATMLFGNTSYMCEKENVTTPTTGVEVSLVRHWTNPTYQAIVMFDKLVVYDKTATNVLDLQADLLKALNKEDKDFEVLQDNMKRIYFVNNGTCFIEYDKKGIEISTWSWVDKTAGRLKTVISGKSVEVDIRFTAGEPNKVSFIISNVEEFNVLKANNHTISGRLVVEMKD